ncbi:hypothetical protein [Thermococcus sp. 2319x1]|uniref:hypothetical protein n=1 Tax=Thermococcus sp. 2319x1 TaxID=1674923 RepID=UPI001EEFFF20|nr:hypothetical protein [Thermococcus sp. 2319x1]
MTEKETLSYLREVFEYHFENTPYWKRMRNKVNLDEIFEGKLEDVFENIFNSNLAVSEDYLRNNWLDFLPENYEGRIRFYQSSGTTRERSILHWDYEYMKLLVKYLKVTLDEIYKLNKIYKENKMRALSGGPYGWYQEEISELVWSYGGILYFIGLETDGVKRELEEKGVGYILKMRYSPFLKYTKRVLEKDHINFIRTIPHFLDLYLIRKEEILTIIFSGVGLNMDAIELARKKFPNSVVIPFYGYYGFGDNVGIVKNNDLMYFPNYPFTIVFPLKVTRNGYTIANRGESGKMGLIIARPELLVVKLEDDYITRAAPEKPFKWDGFANPKRRC